MSECRKIAQKEYKNETHKILYNLEIQTDSLIQMDHPILKSRLINQKKLINKKRRTCHQVNLAVPVHPWGKIKESKKIDHL